MEKDATCNVEIFHFRMALALQFFHHTAMHAMRPIDVALGRPQ